MTIPSVYLFIDGSAKSNFIGAGIVVVSPHYESPLIYSHHMRLNQVASSSLAEFFALRKALEWIDEHMPEGELTIVTDSQEVALKTPRHQAPHDVLALLHQLENTNRHIKIQQSQPKHQRFIDKAHNASRTYIIRMKSNQSLPTKSSFIWICLHQQDSKWVVSQKEGDVLVIDSDPILALYNAVKIILQNDSHVGLYFDLNSTQTIRYYVSHYPSNQADYLMLCLQRKPVKFPALL